MKKSELEQLIREIVQEEFRTTTKAYINKYVPAVIGEVVSDLVEHKLQNFSALKKTNLKEQILNEGEELSEWPMLGNQPITSQAAKNFDRSKLTDLLGYGSFPGYTSPSKENVVNVVVTDAGVEVPVDPSIVPEYISSAVNRDYRSFMKKLEEKKNA